MENGFDLSRLREKISNVTKMNLSGLPEAPCPCCTTDEILYTFSRAYLASDGHDSISDRACQGILEASEDPLVIEPISFYVAENKRYSERFARDKTDKEHHIVGVTVVFLCKPKGPELESFEATLSEIFEKNGISVVGKGTVHMYREDLYEELRLYASKTCNMEASLSTEIRLMIRGLSSKKLVMYRVSDHGTHYWIRGWYVELPSE